MLFSGAFLLILPFQYQYKSSRFRLPFFRRDLLPSPLLPLLLLLLFMNENTNEVMRKTAKTPDILDVFMNLME